MTEITVPQIIAIKVEQPLSQKVNTALIDFQHQLLELFPHEIEQIILYGSCATDQATPDSDVDVIVLANWRGPAHPQNYYLGGSGDPRWQQIVDLAMDVMIAHSPYISVLMGDSPFNSNWSVAEAAKQEGKVLWQKQLSSNF